MLEQIRDFLGFTAEELKQEVLLKRKDSVFYLVLNRKGNAFNADFLKGINAKLDIVEQCQDAVSLVALSTGKLFSGGLDLGSLRTFSVEQTRAFVSNVIRLFGRLLGFNCPTLCLVRGAAYAGGCMLAFSFDEIHCYETGTFCCNEVEMGLPLPPGMNAVVQRRMHHPRDVRDMVLYAKKFSAEEGLKIGFVDSIIKENPLTTMHKIAEARAAYSAHRDNFKKLKEQMNRHAINCCLTDQYPDKSSNNQNKFSKL